MSYEDRGRMLKELEKREKFQKKSMDFQSITIETLLRFSLEFRRIYLSIRR